MAPNYGSVGGVFLRFPAIGSVSVVTSNLVEAYLLDAEAWVEGQLAHFYATYYPISVTSAPVLRVAAETRCLATIFRRFYTQEKENRSEWVQSWFDDAKEMLEPFKTGSAQLLPGVVEGTVDGLILSNVSNYRPTFDIGPMEEQTVDENRLNDIRNARF